MSSWCLAARSRSDAVTRGSVLPAMNRAVVGLNPGVRTVLVAEPTALTSLKSAGYVGTCHRRRRARPELARRVQQQRPQLGQPRIEERRGRGRGRLARRRARAGHRRYRRAAVVLAQLDESVRGALAIGDSLLLLSARRGSRPVIWRARCLAGPGTPGSTRAGHHAPQLRRRPAVRPHGAPSVPVVELVVSGDSDHCVVHGGLF